ncbi:MAG: class I SAM-dependent methyltransferase [Chloroflexota bacterium]|nr:MAG: SAM-dependent methyltransferase [Chloroflexota bacterium]
MTEDKAPEQHVLRNREAWNARPASTPSRACETGRENPLGTRGGIPESEARLLPDVEGLDVIELGCGTAYVSAWLARRGARVTGIDNSPAQLATARSLQEKFGMSFPLIHGDAENLPFPDASFDLAISEYGASIWCDPYRWIPEAARVLRTGGELIFLVNGTILMLCVPDEEDLPAGRRLLRPYFGMHHFEWPEDESVEFHLGYGEWIRLLRRHHFDVENLVELRPGPNATTRYPYVTLEWARHWPSEELWFARKP